MLDIKFIREHKDLITDAARKKHVDFDIEKLLQVDDKRKKLQAHIDEQRAKQNEVSNTIANASGKKRDEMIAEMKELKAALQQEEEKLKKVLDEWRLLMLAVPNIPDMTVPDGDSEEDNKEIKQWGEKPTFGFEPRDHIELMQDLDMVDFDRGSKVHGFRGYFLKNDGVTLSFAVWNYARDFFGEKGFTQMIAPAIVRRENFYGTGHLPNDAEDLYKTQDDDHLAGTAEVPVMGYHRDETLPADALPVTFLAFSPCYRREAGSYGKDTKGLIRVHEFYKWEQVILCEANHEESVKWHERINRNTEEFIESLGIPYRTVINCGGDLGLGQVKKYDVELWVPLEEKYREISSASYFHDFQTRRFNIKYKNREGKSVYAHSLNSTAIPTPRVLVSMVENFQQKDGSVKIPEVLHRYMGKDTITNHNASP